jgi:ferredoxin
MLYIDPEVCIDCSACIPTCPVEAIYEDPIPEEIAGDPGQARPLSRRGGEAEGIGVLKKANIPSFAFSLLPRDGKNHAA